MASSKVGVIFGGASIGAGSSFATVETVKELLEVLEKEGVRNIDTAELYGNSEELLGQANAASHFIIDTKHCGGIIPGESTRMKVIVRAGESLKRLRVEKLNIFHLHAPDSKVPLKETLAGVDELYRAGRFERFGLSNFRASEVEDVVRIAKENNYVPPTIFQGSYNPISRKPETQLFPVLREHGVAFYAYSPIAGGFLTKTKEQLAQGGAGRWDPNSSIGKLYHALYNKPRMRDALDSWTEISTFSGIPKAELAYRWITYHSLVDGDLGDAIVIGSSSVKQLKQTLAGLKNGPLPDGVVKQIVDIWAVVESESVLDNFSPVRSLQ